MTTYDLKALRSAAQNLSSNQDLVPVTPGYHRMTLTGVGKPVVSRRSREENAKDPGKPLKLRSTVTFTTDEGHVAFFYVSMDAPKVTEADGIHWESPVNLQIFLKSMGLNASSFDYKRVITDIVNNAEEDLDFEAAFRDELLEFLRSFAGTEVLAQVRRGTGDRTNVEAWTKA